MRYLVYLLVLANLALFAWYRFFPSPHPAISYSLATPPGIDRLMLLSEREGRRGESVSLASTAEKDAPAQLAPSDNDVGARSDPEVQPLPAEESQVAASEITGEPETEQPEQPEQPQQICQSVGPFLDRKDLNSVFKLLSTQGYIVNIRDGDVREPDGYWVYLPAMSAARARTIVADLDARGMKDYFIGKQNHISLGIFSDAEKARIRQQTVERLGYDAVLDQRYRMRDVFWLDVEQPGKPLLGSALWEKILAEHTDIRVQRVSCE